MSLELVPIAALDVSAASGLVESGGELYVIADDELALCVYDLDGRPRRRIALAPGELPGDPAARKRAKPDFEALCRLPDGALLAFGSGSTPSRARGAIVRGEAVTPIELAPLYDRLRAELPELNVEGAAVAGDRLWLLSRGNGAARLNALVELALEPLFAPSSLRRIVPVALPDLGGAALGFTDAAPAGDGLLFAAAAEDTIDPYLDGAVAGSALGLLDRSGRVVAWEPAGPHKIEGITRLPDGSLRVCTDADDPLAHSSLFGVSWPHVWGS